MNQEAWYKEQSLSASTPFVYYFIIRGALEPRYRVYNRGC